jgi:hypothetical protein
VDGKAQSTRTASSTLQMSVHDNNLHQSLAHTPISCDALYNDLSVLQCLESFVDVDNLLVNIAVNKMKCLNTQIISVPSGGLQVSGSSMTMLSRQLNLQQT